MKNIYSFFSALFSGQTSTTHLRLGYGTITGRYHSVTSAQPRLKIVALISLLLLGTCGVWGASATWTKVTTAPTDWSGEYLIVNESGAKAWDGSLTTGFNGHEGQSVTISSGSITLDDSYSVTLTATTDGYKLQTASGYYIGRSANSNGVDASTTYGANYLITITFTSSSKIVALKGKGGRAIGFMNSAFKFYAASNANVCLYRKNASTCSNTPTMSFDDETVNKTTNDASYTQTVNISGKGSGQTVAYSSSDATVAEVNSSTGVVTLKGKTGSATITASVDEDGDYCSQSATYTISVAAAPIDVTLYYKGTSASLTNQTNPYTLPTTGAYVGNACEEWTFDGWYGSSYAKSTTKPTPYITQLTATGNAYAVYKHTETSGGSAGTTVSMSTFTTTSGYVDGDTNISYAAAKGNAQTAPTVSNDQVRIYQNGGLLTISANNGEKLSSVTIGSGMSTWVRYSIDGGAYTTTSDEIDEDGTLTVDNLDNDEITFKCMGADKNSRLYLNYLSVTYGGGGSSTTYYSTDAECGPRVQATASPWVTSTQGQYVKVEVPVKASNFDVACNLSASVSGTGFTLVGWGANGNSVTANTELITSVILAYCPTSTSNTDAEITFNSDYSGSETPVYSKGTVHGRSLPEKFVIAIKNDNKWWALPANMSGANTYAGIEVDVDNTTNPTTVTAGPAIALYSLLNVNKTTDANDRYADYGTRVRFLGVEKCLWSNNADNGTGINNGAVPASAKSDNYEWTLLTDDGVTYSIKTNVAKKISENRELRYYAGESRFGMYTAGNSSFRLLPVSCTNRATVTSVTPTYEGVSIEWVGDGTSTYTLYVKQGSTLKATVSASASPVVVTGLDSETTYTWILSPGDDDDDCAISSTFTTNVAPINVTLSCDGSTYPLGLKDKPFTLPVAGEQYAGDPCTEWTFEGWTDGSYAKNTTKPTILTQVNASGTYYAVYKNTDGGSGSSTNYTLTISTSDFASAGYAAALNDIDAVDDDDNTNTMSVSFSKSEAGMVGSNIQFKSGGYIYNTTDLGTINSISTNSSYVSYYINDSQNPSSSGSGGYFKLYGTSSTATNNVTSSIDIHFTIGSGSTTYYSTSSECCSEVAPPTVSVDKVDVSATISWNSQSGATNGYHVTCSNGTDQDVAAGTTSLTITGLTPSETYTYTVIAKGPTCNRSTTGSFTTAGCSEVPRNIAISATTNSATVNWTAVTPTSTVTIYSDDAGHDVVKTESGLTSGSTITGLEEGTTYYLRVFAGSTCFSDLIEFSTLSTAVSIAEWFPDSIRINLTADEATASVLIEDKQTTSVVTTSYADGLFFSKYYEAYLSVKLWAIFNGTQEKISLANVKVKSANNGNYWGKDVPTDTGSENSSKVTSLASYGHYETGFIYPGEEIIVYSPGNTNPTSDDSKIISCMEDTYGTAYKDNPDSLWYLKNNNTTGLSGDDGLILLDGTDTLDVIGGKNTAAAYAAVTKPSWGDADGWNDSNGTDEEGNVIGLSTNRCLLVRKNSVKSGLNAVAKNTTYFNTISEEWWGKHVPKEGDQIQTSCDNFSYVGHYDYNAYYAKFDSLTTVDELTGKQNPDGTYTIPIPELDTLSCSMLRVKVYETGEEKASVEYKVPIMVEGAKVTTADIFKNEKHDGEACKQCDVVILKGAILTKAKDGTTNDVAQVRNLTVYPGGTLNVPSDGSYSVSSVLLRVEGENVPHTILKGDLNTTDQQVIVTRRINNDRYYFFSLPYDCDISAIRWANGETPTRGTDYEIVEYDAATRAAEGSTKGAPGHWKPVEGSQLKAGVGYNIAVSSKALKELVFPMSIGSTNLTNVEDTKTSNKVTIAKHEGTTTINNHNWNLIAHPYISAFNAYSDANIKAGWLKCTIDEENFTVDWSREETDKVYLTVPSFNAGKITYSQTLSTNITSLDPFLAVFVQGAGEGDLTFDQSNRKLTAPSRRWAAASEYEDQSIFVGVTLRGNGQTDQANVRSRPDFTDDYELGYDLLKFTTFTERPQIYMKTPAHQLAFQAVNDTVAKKSFLPVGVYCKNAGNYTFALSEDYPLDEVEAVYLYDAVTGITTNLLYDTYTITTTKQLYTNTRFSLNVLVNRRSPQITTDIETGDAPENAVRKFLINGHICIQKGNKLYDVTGKNLLNR